MGLFFFGHFRGSNNTLRYPFQRSEVLHYTDGGGFSRTALQGLGPRGASEMEQSASVFKNESRALLNDR